MVSSLLVSCVKPIVADNCGTFLLFPFLSLSFFGVHFIILRARVANAAKSIAKRPEAASDRSEFGHWEIDTVVSGVGRSPACLLTLTERKTRFEITRKIAGKTMDSVTRELDVLERQIGSVPFRKLFKTVTGDNGSEFSDIAGLECSALSEKQRLRLFFAHPYSSFERGTNENHNGIIRRFIPKGADIGDYTKQAVRATQDWMNSYPRKILKGLTPLMALHMELGSEFHMPRILEVKT
jgi:IS30 family transposase